MSHGPRHGPGTGPQTAAPASTPNAAAPRKAPLNRANMISTVIASRSACVRLGDIPSVFQAPPAPVRQMPERSCHSRATVSSPVIVKASQGRRFHSAR